MRVWFLALQISDRESSEAPFRLLVIVEYSDELRVYQVLMIFQPVVLILI